MLYFKYWLYFECLLLKSVVHLWCYNGG